MEADPVYNYAISGRRTTNDGETELIFISQKIGEISVPFTIRSAPCTITNMESEYGPSFSLVEVSQNLFVDDTGYYFNKFINELKQKTDEIKDFLQYQGIKLTKCRKVVNDTNSFDQKIYCKVKKPYLREFFANAVSGSAINLIIKLNCVYKSKDREGLSLEIIGATECK